MNMKKVLMASLAFAAIGSASSVGLYYQSLTMERKENKRKADEYYENAFYWTYRCKDGINFDGDRTETIKKYLTPKGIEKLEKGEEARDEDIKDLKGLEKYLESIAEERDQFYKDSNRLIKWFEADSCNIAKEYYEARIKKIYRRMKEDGYLHLEIKQIRDRAKKRVHDDE